MKLQDWNTKSHAVCEISDAKNECLQMGLVHSALFLFLLCVWYMAEGWENACRRCYLKEDGDPCCVSLQKQTLEKGEHILSVTHFLLGRNGRSMISISNPWPCKLPQWSLSGSSNQMWTFHGQLDNAEVMLGGEQVRVLPERSVASLQRCSRGNIWIRMSSRVFFKIWTLNLP